MGKAALFVVLIVAVLAIVVLNILFFSGVTGNSVAGEKSCGTTRAESFSVTNSEDEGDFSRFENDPAFVCMGRNVLNDCKPSYATITSEMSSVRVKFELLGMSGGKCKTRIEYPPESEITNSNEKIFADKYSECRLDIKNMTENSEVGDKPGAVGAATFALTAFSGLLSKEDCSGTLQSVYDFGFSAS